MFCFLSTLFMFAWDLFVTEKATLNLSNTYVESKRRQESERKPNAQNQQKLEELGQEKRQSLCLLSSQRKRERKKIVDKKR